VTGIPLLEAGNLWELVERRAERTPDSTTAVDERGRAITFSALRDRAERAAAGLQALGIGEGSVVSWQLPTWNEAVVLVAALSRLGAVQNPILPIYRERELGFILRQAGTRLFVVPSQFRGVDFAEMARGLAKGIDGLDVLVCDRELPEGDPVGLPAAPPASSAEDAPVRWLFYTSGTTAEPKGAQHTDHTVMAAARGMCERLALVPSDRSALVFPFTHIGGIIWMFASLLTGLTNLLDEAFDPAGTTEFLQREDVTLAGSGTTFHLAYLKAQRALPEGERLFPHVRCCPGGGAPKPPQLHFDVKRELGGVGIVSGYGLTETPILTMASVDDSDEVLANTEGRPMPGVDLRVVRLDGGVASVGEEGEIRAKAPQLMRGYLDSALDADAFDADGYFRTGDLGKQDKAGNVTITGRLKDVIIRKGENISAKELEDLLFSHPGVGDVAVIGLPDPELGEFACAVVAVADGAPAPTLDELCGFLEEQGLSKRKFPERLEIVDAVPRNPAGKVVKNELRDRFAAAKR
jgi:acyl-CoA synthetase (AMP-forming)/AMP-acid ligase II